MTLKILEFILNLIEKVKPGFLLSSTCMFPELNRTGQNPNLTAFTAKIQVFCRSEWAKGGPHAYKNEFPKQLELEK